MNLGWMTRYHATFLLWLALMRWQRNREERPALEWLWQPLRLFNARAFLRHCEQHHNADYEVCPDGWCRAMYWAEQRFGRWLYPWGMEE